MMKMMTTTRMDRCRAERCFRPWPDGPSVARERGAGERDALGRPSSPQLRRSRGFSPEVLAALRLRRPPLRPWRGLRNHSRSGPHGKASGPLQPQLRPHHFPPQPLPLPLRRGSGGGCRCHPGAGHQACSGKGKWLAGGGQ